MLSVRGKVFIDDDCEGEAFFMYECFHHRGVVLCREAVEKDGSVENGGCANKENSHPKYVN